MDQLDPHTFGMGQQMMGGNPVDVYVWQGAGMSQLPPGSYLHEGWLHLTPVSKSFVIVNKEGKVVNVEGQVANIRGEVKNLRGRVYNDHGIVYNEDGVVFNAGGNVDNLRGHVTNLAGQVRNSGGTVANQGGLVQNDRGEVTNVRGKVENYSGTVANTQGVVLNLLGNVANWHGQVMNHGGSVDNLEGSVANNRGKVINKRGTVANMQGLVDNVDGMVANWKGFVQNTKQSTMTPQWSGPTFFENSESALRQIQANLAADRQFGGSPHQQSPPVLSPMRTAASPLMVGGGQSVAVALDRTRQAFHPPSLSAPVTPVFPTRMPGQVLEAGLGLHPVNLLSGASPASPQFAAPFGRARDDFRLSM